MNSTMQLQVPAEVRNFAGANVDQAENAFDRVLHAVRELVNIMKMPDAVHDIQKTSLDLTEKHMKAAFEHIRKLIQATDLEEITRLQTEFLTSQFAAAQEQLKLGTGGISAAGGNDASEMTLKEEVLLLHVIE